MSAARAAGRASPRADGDIPELDIDALALSIEHGGDWLVVHFVELYYRTTRAEKASDPAAWTPAERAAYDRDDWEAFSRLRGSADEEVADFQAYLEVAAAVATKYGTDIACSIAYLTQRHIESSDRAAALRYHPPAASTAQCARHRPAADA